jgi:hypothetical protein
VAVSLQCRAETLLHRLLHMTLQLQADHHPAGPHGRSVRHHPRRTDISFLPDGTLDELSLPARIGATRVGGIDLNKPRMRAAPAAVLALTAPAPRLHRGRPRRPVQQMTGQAGYTIRQAAYDLRKLRGTAGPPVAWGMHPPGGGPAVPVRCYGSVTGPCAWMSVCTAIGFLEHP